MRLASFFALAALASCKAQPPSQGMPPPPAETAPVVAPEDELGRALPDRAGSFAAGPLSQGDQFVRRTYAHGAAHVEVTLARFDMPAGGYAGWVQQLQAYPVAKLDVPDEAGSGFYTCSESSGREGCDLHIQLAAGFHVELMSGASATRAELDEVARSMPLRALAASAR